MFWCGLAPLFCKQTVRTNILAAHRTFFYTVGEGFPLPFFYKGSFIPTVGGPRPSPTEIEGDRLFVR